MFQMIFDKVWLLFSLVLFFVWILRFFLQPKWWFWAPQKLIKFEKKIIYKILVSVIFLLILLLPLNFGIVQEKKIIRTKNLPIQILFDVSLSMAWTDIKPSRFHAAKKSLLFLLKKLNGYNISLIAFSWKPFIYMPFSTNTKALQNKFENTVLADFDPTRDFVWTAIWDALFLWLQNIKSLYDYKKSIWQKNLVPGIIILITDWDSNLWVNPLEVTKLLSKLNIPVFTLWIWDKDFVVWRWKLGQPIMWYVNIPLLKKISSETKWKFYKVKNISDFFEIFDEISQIVKNQEQKKIIYKYFYLNQVFIVLLIVLWIFYFYLRFIKIK